MTRSPEQLCGKQKRMNALVGSLESLSVKDMKSRLKLKATKTMTRMDLCDRYQELKGTAKWLRVHLGFFRNDGANSCYLDAALISLFHHRRGSHALRKALFRGKINFDNETLNHSANTVRLALIEMYNQLHESKASPKACTNIRKAFQRFDKEYAKEGNMFESINWLRTQQEPLDVTNALLRIFRIPDTVRAKIWLTSRNKKQNSKKIQRLPFNAPILSAGDLLGRNVVYLRHILPIQREKLGKLTKTTEIVSVGSKGMLMVNIMRNYLDEEKLMTKVIPSETWTSSSKTRLECVSIIIHHGESTSSGHYTTMIKHDANNVWYHYDDLEMAYTLIGTWKDMLLWNKRFVIKNCVAVIYVPKKRNRVPKVM